MGSLLSTGFAEAVWPFLFPSSLVAFRAFSTLSSGGLYARCQEVCKCSAEILILLPKQAAQQFVGQAMRSLERAEKQEERGRLLLLRRLRR